MACGVASSNAADAARPGAQLIYFFTAGEDEVKCWQIRKGCKAPQARPMICSQ
jgi:ribosome-binding ATPase YchF (GTP1/OBG family)